MKAIELILAGDFVRAFDFDFEDLEGERACYFEGNVLEVGTFPEDGIYHETYKIQVTGQVAAGKVRTEFPEIIYAAKNGTDWTGENNRVHVIKTHASAPKSLLAA